MTYPKQLRVKSTAGSIRYQVAGKYVVSSQPESVQTGIMGFHIVIGRLVGKERVLVTLAELTPDGWLTLYPGFQWDGPSGGIDTPSTMRGSAVHDALCAMIGMGKLPRIFVEHISTLYSNICADDGMVGVRAWWHRIGTTFASPVPSEYMVERVAP